MAWKRGRGRGRGEGEREMEREKERKKREKGRENLFDLIGWGNEPVLYVRQPLCVCV